MTGLSFGLLGPVTVEDAAGDIDVRGAVRRRLLVRLLIAANRPVPIERLREDLWDGSPPASAASTLKSHVSLLRRSLGAARLTHRDGAYVLTVQAEELDTELFEKDVSAGRQSLRSGEYAAAATSLARGLGRWRGRALADAVDSAWATPEAVRLEELRAAALEAWFETRLALGDYHGVVADAEVAVAEHPLREGLWVKLITALYLADCQADALRAFQRVRNLLAEELGIAPSPELAALESAILRQDPALGRGTRPTRSPVGQARTTNLPVELSSFIPRPRELSEVRRLLETSALVTLTGPGGTGKTRLALRAAAEAAGGYDGVWMCDLAAITDDSVVVRELASVVGCAEQPGVELVRNLARQLSDGTNLVILDNCEHLLDPIASLVVELRRAASSLHILATSRSPLSVEGEAVFPVPSMSVPVASDSAEQLLAFESVQLFVARATGQQPSFRLDDGNARAVAAICTRLDGIPLALELAAARLRSMSLADVERALDDRFGLLTGGARTAPRRQQTLKGLIDWSYELLDQPERDLFRRLSVFAGSFDLPAAEAVAPDVRPSSVVDVLSSLVDKSLMHLDVSAETTRYRMLETVRVYAARQMSAEEAIQARAAHAAHFLELVRTAAPHFSDAGQVPWRLRLEADDGNLRAAFAALLEGPSAEDALSFGAAVSRYWNSRGFYGDDIEPLVSALDRPDAKVESLARGSALTAAGYLLFRRGEPAAAQQRLDEALTTARTLESAAISADALRTLAWLADRRGDHDGAIELAERAVEEALASRESHLIARAYEVRAAASQQKDPLRARADYAEALRYCRATSDLLGLATTLNNLAILELEQDQQEAARARFREALRIAEEVGDAALVPFLQYGVGLTAALGQDYRTAEGAFVDAFCEARRTGQRTLEAYALLGLAVTCSASGDWHRAALFLGASSARFADVGEQPEQIEATLRERAVEIVSRELAGDFEPAVFEGSCLNGARLATVVGERL